MKMHKHIQLRVLNGPFPVTRTDITVPKFWNVVNVDEDEAEITMYGEIVARRPVDWWTGEPMQGLFVSPEEFLEDLAQVKDKSKITVRINSVGGDLYTALGICTQLKGLAGTKTAIIDGIAASAATIIASGCDVIKMPAGGLFMIHEALMTLVGAYNDKALMEVRKRLEAANKSAAETYATKTKLDIDKIRNMMAKETWMTGREAVDQGFADELLDDETAMVMSVDRNTIIVNGVQHSIMGLRNIPGSIPIVNSVLATATPQGQAKPKAQGIPVASTNTNQKGGKTTMDLEELKASYPELVVLITNEATTTAKAQAVADERARLQAIEEIEATVGDSELIAAAKYGDKACTAAELAFQAMKKQAQLGAQHLENMAADFAASGTANVSATPNAGNPASKAAGDQSAAEDMAKIANAVAMIVGQNPKKEA